MKGKSLVLAVKNGNEETTMGLFDGDELLDTWALATRMSVTSDEVELSVHSFLRMRDLPEPADAIMCSVVPALLPVWKQGLACVVGASPLVVGPGLKSGIAMGYKDPGQVGGDRVVCAVAAREIYGEPVIVCDFGTTTSLSVVGPKGSFLGGAIAPGLGVSMEALCESAAQLAEVRMQVPSSAIGRTTADAIRAGVVLGEAARVDGLVDAVFDELGCEARLVATGRYATTVCPACAHEFDIREDLALQGLRIIYRLNTR